MDGLPKEPPRAVPKEGGPPGRVPQEASQNGFRKRSPGVVPKQVPQRGFPRRSLRVVSQRGPSRWLPKEASQSGIRKGTPGVVPKQVPQGGLLFACAIHPHREISLAPRDLCLRRATLACAPQSSQGGAACARDAFRQAASLAMRNPRFRSATPVCATPTRKPRFRDPISPRRQRLLERSPLPAKRISLTKRNLRLRGPISPRRCCLLARVIPTRQFRLRCATPASEAQPSLAMCNPRFRSATPACATPHPPK